MLSLSDSTIINYHRMQNYQMSSQSDEELHCLISELLVSMDFPFSAQGMIKFLLQKRGLVLKYKGCDFVTEFITLMKYSTARNYGTVCTW